MYCPKCGKMLAAGARFCTNCGNPVEIVSAQPNVSTPPPPVQPVYYPQPQVPSQQNSYPNQGGMTGYAANPDVTLQDKYLSWHGRLNRKPYMIRSLILWIPATIVRIMIAVAEAGRYDGIYLLLGLLAMALTVAVAVANVCVSVRRCHDMNHSGWWVLIPFYTIYLLFPRGTVGPNNYGPDPMQTGDF